MGRNLKCDEDGTTLLLADFENEGPLDLFVVSLGMAVELGKDFVNEREVTGGNGEL